MSLRDEDQALELGQRSPELGESSGDETVAAVRDGTVVNHSGYRDQLKRQYGLLGLAGIALTVDNAWVALGSSISVSIGTQNPISMTSTTYYITVLIPHASSGIANGGPPGLIFGLIVAVFYYSFIGLGLAEVCVEALPFGSDFPGPFPNIDCNCRRST